MAFTPFSAKNAQVRFNGNIFTAKKWSVEVDGGYIETTYFEGGGYSDRIAAIKSIVATITFDYDSSANMFAGSLNLFPGTVGTNAILYLNGTANVNACWTLPSFLVCPVTNDAGVKDNFAGTIKIKNKGSFTGPTGAF